jgi:tRNA A-37 threonylcarbamoyl transferase component Bud32/FixJ family two-component response regulator
VNPSASASLSRDGEGAAAQSRPPAAGRAPTPLCLVVHDELDLRLKLAGLVHRATGRMDANSSSVAGLEALSVEQLKAYVVVLLIVEFMPRDPDAEPLGALSRLRARAPRLPIFVFARHGDERWAARAIKAGATDYWPIHSVDLKELGAQLRGLAEPRRAGRSDTERGEVAGYRIMKKLAQSSAATVYLARSDELAQPVALKVQPVKGADHLTQEDRQRFARECEILSSLNHRAIADIIDHGITPDYLYLALEYFPCGSLRDRLRNPVSRPEALDYVRQIAEALQVVHAAGIVHRDLKPSNLMLTRDNRVVLIDFGSARAQLIAQDLSRSDLMTGTPYYVCPEQIEGRNVDQRADLYSLGVVFYEMLAGTLPFRGNTLTEIFDGHRTGTIPVLPSALAPYQGILNRLLAKRPEDRYASAAELLRALEERAPAPARESGGPAT